MDQVESIVSSDLSEVEKLVRAFDRVTGRAIETAEKEIELARAMQDSETVVKEQIKLETIKHARKILDECYGMITRRRRGDE